MIKEFAHICFNVRDLDVSIGFYVNVLGLTKAFDFVRDSGERYGVYLKIGRRSFVELFRTGEIVPADKASYRHMCLEVGDLKAVVASLRDKGVNVTDAKMGLDNSWQAWLSDPDGNRIELHEYTAASWQTPHLQ